MNFDRARYDEQPAQSSGERPQEILDNPILTCAVPTSACTVSTLRQPGQGQEQMYLLELCWCRHFPRVINPGIESKGSLSDPSP